MCGIVGGISHGSPIFNAETISQALTAIEHRGPDDSGTYQPAGVTPLTLGHRRLSIIDLSSAGHQPMSDDTGTLHVVFNGEIYNHSELRSQLRGHGYSFRSDSDTEVLLYAYRHWGTNAVQKLRGMFSFCLYDQEKQHLFFARDRAGEKPLYYYHRPPHFAFASELKALLAEPLIPRQLDLAAFEHYLAYGYVPHDKCILSHIRKLPPAHVMLYRIEQQTLSRWRYWSLPQPTAAVLHPDTAPSDSDADILAEFEDLLQQAVKEQLVADVPVGILLSGGIDSSLVTGLAARLRDRPVRTFTVSFSGHGKADEGPKARLVAQHFGTEHCELRAAAANIEILPRLAAQFDEPIADHAIVPTYHICKQIREHATVALGGDGGDELFGGYPHYSALLRSRRLRQWIPPICRNALSTAAKQWLPLGTRGRNHIIGLSGELSNSIAHINLYFDARSRRVLLRNAPSGETPEHYRRSLCADNDSVLRQSMEADFLSTLSDGYLVKVDRASMLASLEIRAPFLDHRLIEFAFSRVPDRLKADASRQKILPKRLAAKMLPGALDQQRKQGFTMPLASWFSGRSGDFLRDTLSGCSPDLFNPSAIAQLLEGQSRGRNNAARLFSIAIFELWRKAYAIELPTQATRNLEAA